MHCRVTKGITTGKHTKSEPQVITVRPDQVQAARLRLKIARILGEPVDKMTAAIADAKPSVDKPRESVTSGKRPVLS